VLRIRFTPQDLGRVRLVSEPDPLWELVLSVAQLGRADLAGTAQRAWQRSARQATSGGLPARARNLLGALVPGKGNFPDFLTPRAASDGFDAGLVAMRALPRTALRADLATAMSDRRTVPGWVRSLADADPDARTLLELALREYFKAVVAPHWPLIRRQVLADRTIRAGVAAGGVETLLGGISPSIRWRWPVLETDYPCEQSVDLSGRGLVLIPSFFCDRVPVSFIDPELPPVLVYQATPPRDYTGERGIADVPALVKVLGRTRAHILVVLDRPGSTTELAGRIDMSIASASHHVGLLRDAGLVRTTRTGIEVSHELTGLGRDLLDRASDKPFNLA
jgi:DNA-binding transcriptional ArsR family regulator